MDEQTPPPPITTHVFLQGWMCWSRCSSCDDPVDVWQAQDARHHTGEAQSKRGDLTLKLINDRLAGHGALRAVFPSILGRPKMPCIMVGMNQEDSCVTDESQSKRSLPTLKYPMKNVIATNLEHCWQNHFHCELRVTKFEPHGQPRAHGADHVRRRSTCVHKGIDIAKSRTGYGDCR